MTKARISNASGRERNPTNGCQTASRNDRGGSSASSGFGASDVVTISPR